MTTSPSSLRLALSAGTALVFAAAGTLAASGTVWRMYGEAPGMDLVHKFASIAAWAMAVCVLAAAAAIALPVALRPADSRGKLLLVIPALLVASTAKGMVFQVAEIGTVGDLIRVPLIGGLSLTAVWIIKSGFLSFVAAMVVLQRGAPDAQSQRRALRSLHAASLPGLVLGLALAGALALAVTHPPSMPAGFGAPPGGAPAGSNGGGQAGAPADGSGQGQTNAPGAPVTSGAAAAPGAPAGNGAGAPGAAGGGAPSGPASPLPAMAIGIVLFFLLLGLLRYALSQARRAQDDARLGATSASVAASGEVGRALLAALALVTAGLLLSQLVRPARDNPPPQEAMVWDTPATKDLATRACMDCHSNETVWPWYTGVAPSSWLTVLHVRRGRESINLSELNALSSRRRDRLPDSLERAVTRGSMPPFDYLLMHPEARLSDAERQQLADGFKASLAER